MKVLLVGEAPSRGGDPAAPLEGKIGRRLAEFSGLTFEEYLARTDRINLFGYWPGAAGKGSSFPMNEAVWLASLIKISRAKQSARVILLGKRVAKAFGMRSPAYLEWCDFHGVQYAVIPHPSGINRWYNSTANKSALRRFLSESLR